MSGGSVSDARSRGRVAPRRSGDREPTLSSALAVPLRERNTLLQAAGYAPLYRETPLEAPEMADVVRAVKLILKQHGPKGGAVAVDRRWDIVMANASYTRMQLLLGPERCPIQPLELTTPPRPNVLPQLFDPEGIRPYITNWDVLARVMLTRLREEVAWSQDPAARELLEAVLSSPGVPEDWREAHPENSPSPLTPVELSLPQGRVRLFSTITTLGTPQDITLRELRIESFHAADEESEQLVQELVASAP